MTLDAKHDAEAARWPPAVGSLIHHNTGWAHSSWFAEVRAIVDDEVAVLLMRGRPDHVGQYMVLHRLRFEEFDVFRVGPLPSEMQL